MPLNSLLVLGLMSGTSADGIDAALVKISGAPPNLKIKLLNCTHQSFAPAIRQEILRVAEQNPLTPAKFSQLHARLGHVYADAALAAAKKFRIPPKKIDLIANHGQTIFHQGSPVPFLGAKTASTLQLGDGSIIANVTGITTVSDFRPADMAVGGQGAPLVPFADYLLYRHQKLGRVSLNLGGIANITVIPANATPQDVFAFDTGPANILIDAFVQHLTHNRQQFDRDALIAKQGQINRQLMRALLREPYLKEKPPKSTGREYFGREYVRKILALARRYRVQPNDLIRTVTTFTAVSVIDALHRFVLPKHKINEIIVSGGGAQNSVILEALTVFAMAGADPKDLYKDATPKKVAVYMCLPGSPEHTRLLSTLKIPKHALISVICSSQLGIPTEAKEALAFALMAYETFHHRPSNLPSATGASRPAVLGKISYA